MAVKKTEGIDWGKLLADLQALKAGGVAIAALIKQIIQDFVSKSKEVESMRAAKPLKCDPGCFDATLDSLERQRQYLCHSMCVNLCVTSDIEKCCSCDDGGDDVTPV